MRKRQNIILLLFMFLLVPINTFANSDISLFIDGNYVKSDVAPIIENGRTLVPVRIISENLGYKVSWNARKETVEIDGNNIKINMPINSKSAKVNNKKVKLDVPAKIIQNRTFVPVRFIGENLGTTVDWDDSARTVIVGSGYQKSTNNFEKATVTRVVDGDTIIVNLNGNDERLRMILVDTPETVHPKKPVQCFGKEASDYTKEQLSNKTVYLQKDVSDRDRYNRLLRYVWLDRPFSNEPTDAEIKKSMYNAILVKEGYGKISTFPPDIKYVELFRELDRNAREKNKGLWACDEYKENKNVNNISKTTSTSKDKKTPANTSTVQNGKIKGNKNSKIYHVPGGASYDKLSEKNTIYFNSEKDAINAGYRKSKN